MSREPLDPIGFPQFVVLFLGIGVVSFLYTVTIALMVTAFQTILSNHLALVASFSLMSLIITSLCTVAYNFIAKDLRKRIQ